MKHKSTIFSLFIIISIILNSCTTHAKYKKVEASRFAMGTIIKITVLDSTEEAANKAIEAAYAEISRIGSLFYERNPESPLYTFNHRNTDIVEMPEEVLNLVNRGIDISEKTDGAFDMTVGIILPLYNFKAENPLPPEQSKITELLPYINYKDLISDNDAKTLASKSMESQLATGAIAKGYGVDRAIEILNNMGVAGALVNCGGDLRSLARKDGQKWKVGIQHQRNPEEILYILNISQCAVTTSGDYEKYFFYEGKRIHHIINPKTGLPADSCRSVTVIAPTTELADGLATALFVLGPAKALKVLKKDYPDCSALIIRHDGREFQSDNFRNYILK